MEKWKGTPYRLAGGLGVIGLFVIAVLTVAPGGSQAQQGPDDLKAPEADPGLDVLACYEVTTSIPLNRL